MSESKVDGEYLERLRPGDADWVRFNAEHLVRYTAAARRVAGKRVLDAGCGYGYGAALLKAAGAASVVAVDIDAAVIEQARRRYGGCGLEYIVDDCHTLEQVGGPFDVVCNFENIEHLAHPGRFLAAAAGLMRRDGLLLCSSPALERYGDAAAGGRPPNPYHVQEWTRRGFAELLAESFGCVVVDAQVMTHAYVRRAGVVDALWAYITRFQRNPFMRLGDKLRRMITGEKPDYPPLDGLSTPTMEDYPIVPGPLADAFGELFCHYAECREPIVSPTLRGARPAVAFSPGQ